MTSALRAAGADAEKLEGNFGDPVQPCPLKVSWIEISLTSGGEPCAGVRYRVTDRLHSLCEGVLDDDGFARIEQLGKGSCTVSFPEIDVQLRDAPAPAGSNHYQRPASLVTEERHALTLPDWGVDALQATPVTLPAAAATRAARGAGDVEAPRAAETPPSAAEADDDWDLVSLEAR